MKFWLFEEWNGGGKALFKTEAEAQAFRRKFDTMLLEDPEYGEALGVDEYTISEVELNPSDLKKWYSEQ